MKKIFPFLLLFLSACGQNPSTFTQVKAEEAIQLMNESEHYIILDVRTLEEYESGHIPNAVLLTLQTIDAETAAAVIPAKDTTVLVYCRSGNRSKTASALLAELGYEHIYEFGGINSWPYEIEQ